MVTPLTSVQIDAQVKCLAQEYEYSFYEMMRLLSTRKSLTIVADLLGWDRPIRRKNLEALGSYFQHRGYIAPCIKSDEVTKKIEEDDEMTHKMTKEQYLQERLNGKTRTQIGAEHGVPSGSLYHMLEKWGIKEGDAEQQAIRAFAGVELTKRAETKVPSAVLVHAENVQKVPEKMSEQANIAQELEKALGTLLDQQDVVEDHSTNQQIVVRVTLGRTLHYESQPKLRKDMIECGLYWIEAALENAMKELQELLGEEDVHDTLQAYVDRITGIEHA